MSQSFQVAPFDNGYWPPDNSTSAIISYDTDNVVVNSYRGGVYQQALSHLAYVTDDVFVLGGGDFGVYGKSPTPLGGHLYLIRKLMNRIRILCKPKQPR